MAALKPRSENDHTDATGRRRAGNDASAAVDDRIPRIDSSALLGAAGRVVIEHHGQQYQLRETRFGKLILTK